MHGCDTRGIDGTIIAKVFLNTELFELVEFYLEDVLMAISQWSWGRDCIFIMQVSWDKAFHVSRVPCRRWS